MSSQTIIADGTADKEIDKKWLEVFKMVCDSMIKVLTAMLTRRGHALFFPAETTIPIIKHIQTIRDKDIRTRTLIEEELAGLKKRIEGRHLEKWNKILTWDGIEGSMVQT